MLILCKLIIFLRIFAISPEEKLNLMRNFPVFAASVLVAILLSCSSEDVLLFPGKGAEGVNVDTHLALTFDEQPTVGTAGWIRIFDAATGECVDSLDLSVPAGPTESRTYAPDID